MKIKVPRQVEYCVTKYDVIYKQGLRYDDHKTGQVDFRLYEIGIDPDELESCQTEEEMEVNALRFKLTKEPEVKETEKTPKFDLGVSSGGGLPAHPTAEQLEAWSPEQYAVWWKSRQT